MVDELIKSSLTTAQMGVAKADGKLTLTTTALSFVPFNAQLGLSPYHFHTCAMVGRIWDACQLIKGASWARSL